MKDIKVSELKAHLSRYLRMAERGSRILVRDRDEPVAELGPPTALGASWRERLAHDGRLKLGSQRWASLSITRLGKVVDVQASLSDVREDPSEVRRR